MFARKSIAALSAALLLATPAIAGTITWEGQGMEGAQATSFVYYGNTKNVFAGATKAIITGDGFDGSAYYGFCIDPDNAYVPNFSGEANPIVGLFADALADIYNGIRNPGDYAAAQMAVWEAVVDGNAGQPFDFTSGNFTSSGHLVSDATALMVRGRAATLAGAPRQDFLDVDPHEKSWQAFGVVAHVATVPEPGSLALFTIAGALAIGSRRRATKSQT